MKKCIVALLFATSAYLSQAAYLYWQVTSDQLEEAGITGNYVNLYATAGESSAGGTWLQKAEVGKDVSFDVSGYAGGSYSFYVEVINYDSTTGDVVSTGISLAPTKYSELVTNKSIVNSVLDIPTAVAWTGGAVVAPEPTTGLLMLFGLAGLALKRRKI